MRIPRNLALTLLVFLLTASPVLAQEVSFSNEPGTVEKGSIVAKVGTQEFTVMKNVNYDGKTTAKKLKDVIRSRIRRFFDEEARPKIGGDDAAPPFTFLYTDLIDPGSKTHLGEIWEFRLSRKGKAKVFMAWSDNDQIYWSETDSLAREGLDAVRRKISPLAPKEPQPRGHYCELRGSSGGYGECNLLP